MKSMQKTFGRFALLGTLGLVAGTSACAHVGQEDFDAGMASLRADLSQEIQDGDMALEGRLNGRIEGVEARLAQLDGDIQSLQEEFDVTVERLETALRFNAPVHFGFDDATVDGNGGEILGRFAQVAQEYYPEALITVEGFTDPSGPAAYNLQLGQRRADAVKAFLVENAGYTDDMVRAVSYGEDTSRLIAAGERGPGQAGWQNRRVVLVIDHNGMIPEGATIAGEKDRPIG
jgi:peptidoglycan-associated lipoprotein